MSEKQATTPMVSVWMITYNHEPYISQAIESILEQKTNFEFELVIGEDHSTDKTAEIIKQFELKHPQIIKARYNSQNIGMIPNMIKTLEECSGKYIALCEGDDFWTDPYKLQKQVDFIESRHNAYLVFSNRQVRNMITNQEREEKYKNRKYTVRDVIGGFVAPTQTILFRNQKDLISFLKKYEHPSGDQLISFFYSLKGSIYCLNEITAAYRITESGAWSSRIKNHDYSIYLYLNFVKKIARNENIKSHFYYHMGLGRKVLSAFGLIDSLIKCKSVNKLNIIYSITIFFIYRILNQFGKY